MARNCKRAKVLVPNWNTAVLEAQSFRLEILSLQFLLLLDIAIDITGHWHCDWNNFQTWRGSWGIREAGCFQRQNSSVALLCDPFQIAIMQSSSL